MTSRRAARPRLDELVIKPFPGCAVNHVPVLLLKQLVARHGVEESQVEGITVRRYFAEEISMAGMMEALVIRSSE